MKIEIKKQINEQVIQKLHDALKLEYESGALYEGMSAWLDYNSFNKTSKFFRIHAVEERKHGSWVIDFLQDMNVLVQIPTVTAPEYKWTCVGDILKETYEHEEMITKTWIDIATLSLKFADHMSYRFAQKLLDEQREELMLFADLIDQYNLSEGKPNSDRLFDNSIDHPAIEEEPWLEAAEKEAE